MVSGIEKLRKLRKLDSPPDVATRSDDGAWFKFHVRGHGIELVLDDEYSEFRISSLCICNVTRHQAHDYM